MVWINVKETYQKMKNRKNKNYKKNRNEKLEKKTQKTIISMPIEKFISRLKNQFCFSITMHIYAKQNP